MFLDTPARREDHEITNCNSRVNSWCCQNTEDRRVLKPSAWMRRRKRTYSMIEQNIVYNAKFVKVIFVRGVIPVPSHNIERRMI